MTIVVQQLVEMAGALLKVRKWPGCSCYNYAGNIYETPAHNSHLLNSCHTYIHLLVVRATGR